MVTLRAVLAFFLICHPLAANAAEARSRDDGQEPSVVAHVGSYRAETDANQFADAFLKRFGSEPHSVTVKKVDLHEKGIWYRVLVGGFSSPLEARAFCSSVVSKRGDCEVLRDGGGIGNVVARAAPKTEPSLPKQERAPTPASEMPSSIARPSSAQKPTDAPPSAADSQSLKSYDELAEVAQIQDTAGNYKSAEEIFRKTLTLQQTTPGTSDTEIGETMISLALEVSNQGRFDEAHDLFQAGQALIQKSVDPIDQARLESYLAIDAANRHSFTEARDLARAATQMRRVLVPANSSAGQSGTDSINGRLALGEVVQSRLLEAAMCLRLRDFGAAGEAVEEALTVIEAIPGLPPSWKPQAMALLGEVEGKLGHDQRAETLLTESLVSYRRLFGEARPVALAWFRVGRFHAEQGRYEEALRDFRQGQAIFEKLPQNGGRLSFDTVLPFFLTTLELAEHDQARHDQLLGDLFTLFQDVQRGRESGIASRSLLRLSQTDPKEAALMRDLQDAERTRDQARLALASEASRPLENRDAGRERALGDQYRAADTKMAEIDAALTRTFPEYSQISHQLPLPLKELQALLQPGEVFVTFAFGDEASLVFAATSTSVDAKLLKISSAGIGEMVRDLRQGLTVRQGRVGKYDVGLANKLYRTLLLPVQPLIDRTDRMVVAASGPLSSLPLAALVTEAPGSDDIRQAQWLINRTSLSQMPSATAFAALRRQGATSKANYAFLGIGNPMFVGTEKGLSAALSRCGDGRPIPADFLSSLPPLPDTATEVQNVAKAVGGSERDLLLGANATEQALRARPLDQYRILYFATHGLLPSELRCQSEPALALSPPLHPAESKAEDGILEASEIAGLKLDAELVVLSACNTATASGKFGGETLASLSDMFFYAGSRAVLATNWPVPSTSTTRLMSYLFKIHSEAPKEGYAAALRRAQLTVAADAAMAHPVHWAGFSLIGGT